MQLFSNLLPLEEKRITTEVCVHHLHFSSDDYATLGNRIKCNPAIKAPRHREALWTALLDDRLDLIATDHAPHTLEEKGLVRNADGSLSPIGGSGGSAYERAHAGLPLVQHSLLLMLHYVKEGRISLEKVVEKMSHAVATCFRIEERGFIREGYFADLVIVDMGQPSTVLGPSGVQAGRRPRAPEHCGGARLAAGEAGEYPVQMRLESFGRVRLPCFCDPYFRKWSFGLWKRGL